jgi:hypothetical protein
MDYSLVLHLSILILALMCLALVPVIARRDPAPLVRIARIDALPREQWPGLMTRAGFVCLLVAFILLLLACELMLPI